MTTLAFLLLLPFLLRNRYLFPLTFVCLNNDILRFSYGLKYELFRFDGGVILLSDYYYFILIALTYIEMSNHKINFLFNKLIYIMLFLVFTAGIASLFFEFNVNTFIKIMRLFMNYIQYVYLVIYISKDEINMKIFTKTILYLVSLSFIIQYYEIFTQKRIVFSSIANPENRYYQEGVYLNVPHFGKVLYAWNRMLAFFPIAFFISAYYFLKRSSVIFIPNMLILILIITEGSSP